jgi:phenylalanyl-tRNA synthetase beta chain
MKCLVFLETGTRNERRLCAVYYNKTPSLETVHGLLDRVMTLLKVPYNENRSNDKGYYLNNQNEGKIINFTLIE